MMIDNNVEDEIVDDLVNVTNENMERYQVLIDQLKGCLEELREKKEAKIRQKEDKMQGDRFKRRMSEELKIEEMKLEIKKKKDEDKDITANMINQVTHPDLATRKLDGTNVN